MNPKKFVFLSILGYITTVLLLVASGYQPTPVVATTLLENAITVTPRARESSGPTPTLSPTPTALPTDIPAATTLIYITKEEITEGTVWLEIPKIQVNVLIEMANVVYTTIDLSFDQPRENPKWVPDWSSEIGLPGAALIYGHRQWGPVPKVFTDLDDLEPDDKVIVTSTQNGLTYKVVETMVVDPEEVWSIVIERNEQAKEDGKSQLMLLTCTPWGTNWRRLIVFLALEEANDEP